MGGAEELLEIEPPRWATPSRRVQVSAVLAALLLTAGLVVAVAHRSHHAKSALPVPAGQRADGAIEHVAVRCPAGATCRITGTVPAQTSHLIAVGLPGSSERAHYTVVRTDANALIYRSVNATLGLVELLVIVSLPSSDSRTPIDTTSSPGATIGYVRQYRAGLEIQVQYTGPPGFQPPMQLARSIATDPRLLVLT